MKTSLRSGLPLLAAGLALAACGGGGGSSPDAVADSPPPAKMNTAPTISGLSASQSVARDSSSDAMTFSVDDAESAAAAVDVTIESSNPELISPDAVMLSGNDASRVLRFIPSEGMAGTATITVTATDTEGMSTRQSVDATVTSKERSLREMVNSAFARPMEAEAEDTVGFSWVDNPEDDDTAFDDLLAD